MKVTPVQSVAAPTLGSSSPSAQDARSRAISMLTGPTQAQATPVANPNQVSPEELSLVQAPSTPDESAPLETATEETSAETPPEETLLSKQHAVLARKEKALRAKHMQMEQSIKARETALAAREQELSSKSTTIDPSKYVSIERFKSDPVGVMMDTGMSYDDLTNHFMNQQPRDPRTESTISKLEAKILALETAQDDSKKNYQTQQQAAYEAAVNQIRADAKNLISSDPSFGIIKATNSINDVVELIQETYKQDGILLSVEEAAQEVETYLEEEAVKLTNIDKIKKRLQTASTAQVKTQAQQPDLNSPKQPQQIKTLTNSISSTRQPSAKERAIAAFKGELKS